MRLNIKVGLFIKYSVLSTYVYCISYCYWYLIYEKVRQLSYLSGGLKKIKKKRINIFYFFRIIEGLFSSTAVLVSFGAIIGKISPLQLIVMTVIEVRIHLP